MSMSSVMELLERESSLGVLEAAFQSAAAGDGRVALVSGEAGIGKTSLLTRFAEARRSSARLLWGACDSLFTPRPLGPLYDIAAQTGEPLLGLLSQNVQWPALFSAVLHDLQASPKPSVVVFEDVHWADDATLDLIRFLGRRIARIPALLVLTYRDDELGPRHPLRSVLGDLATSSIARRIALPPFTETAVRTLVGDRAIDA